ncbi:MAG: iron-containing alcohol dehydrogenase [Clostridia bacterium]|nr:iron-containing alcohol dehydrogenase [Clostridia bacterium]
MKPEYMNNKLVIPEPSCGCTYHIMPNTNLYIGDGIITEAPDYIKAHINGRKCMLVTDENLYRLFGSKLISILGPEYNLAVCIPPSSGELKPDTDALGYIMMEADLDTEFMIAFGSGTVSDLVRYAAANMGIPFVSIGTAASMDGYVSVISPMLKGNLKINKPAGYPKVGIYDLDIIKTAPPKMVFAGFGDVIGKYIAKADWILGSFIINEHVCPYCIELVDTAISLCVENLDEISRRTSKGIKSLLEALLLTGLAMLVNTNSRPAASNEHNMGHYWEMMKLSSGESHPSHGEAVGVATLYCLDFYSRILNADNYDFSPDTLPWDAYDPEKRDAVILEKYGETVGRSIIDDNPGEPVSHEERLRRAKAFSHNLPKIRKALSFLPSMEEVKMLYIYLNGPVSSDDIGIEKELLRDALMYAKDYRERYNIFKTAEEIGLLPQLVDSII